MKTFPPPTSDEELCEELEDYLYCNTDLGFDMIKHPLVFSIMHVPQLNHRMNEQLKAKKKRCDEALENGECEVYIWMHERPFRLEAFQEIADKLSDYEYWRMFRMVWMDSENISENHSTWMELIFESDKSYEAMQLMLSEELRLLNNMAHPVRIFRGGHLPGLSWTLDREKALWFAGRFTPQGERQLHEGWTDRNSIVALFLDRGEKEVLVSPERVWDIKTTIL